MLGPSRSSPLHSAKAFDGYTRKMLTNWHKDKEELLRPGRLAGGARKSIRTRIAGTRML